MNTFEHVLQSQLDLNKTKNLLYTRLDETLEIDPGFLAVLEELCAKEKAFSDLSLQKAISFASQTLIQRLLTVNQFLQIDAEKAGDLESIYRRTWNKILETKNIDATLKNFHYPALASWLAPLYPKHFVERLKSTPVLGQVVCEEYSPELQIKLLRIDLRTIKQPWLDIGCGSSAGLVRVLRTLQIEAYGFDRQIEKAETYLQPSDWFGYRFEPGVWGTITSHMAFTNHFLYAYHHDQTQLGRYTRKFHEILESLMIGGSFRYAPSVPFIEQSLEAEKHQVEQIVVYKDIRMTRIRRVAT